eukprot:TRINITY_DN4212_c0_g1_i1.p1 TRINITY_DN4212_c0_g1~~TRINITY_DN4212_c0_g1_i1.p1  ORF type:complete len:353 (+),score=66.02 TRINITY_DN4212_c0_g1_i1:108-1166(+)
MSNEDQTDQLNESFKNYEPNYTDKEKGKGYSLLDPKDIKFEKVLGDGTSAVVYKGKLTRHIISKKTKKPKTTHKTVAIKVLKESVAKKLWEDFRKELKVMRGVSGPTMVRFYGVALRPRCAVVIEYCSRGSLYHVMKQPDLYFDWPRFFDFSTQTTTSVQALHTHKKAIVHRDLKSLNFLVTEDFKIKIADFGLTRQTLQEEEGDGEEEGAGSSINTMSTLKNCRGTYLYTAPEVFHKQTYSAAADVFSLSIVIWEILMRTLAGDYKRPYSHDPRLNFDMQILIAVSCKGARPEVIDTVPAKLKDLFASCWVNDPLSRPTAEKVNIILSETKAQYEKEKEKWDALLPPKPSS